MERTRKPDARDGWYRISPSSAQKLIDEMPKNRPLREHRALRLASVIKGGRWIENGEPIILDDNGQLIDGQHRVRAVVISERTIVSYIVHLPKSGNGVFDSIDAGASRTAADRFALIGIQHYSLLAATVRLVILNESGFTTTGGGRPEFLLTGHDLRVRYDKDAALFDKVASLCSSMASGFTRRSPLSYAAFVMFCGMKADGEVAERFVRAVATGENLTASSPAMALRNRLIMNATSKAKLPGRELIALWIRAYCMYRDKRQCRSLRWHANRPFPSFSDTVTQT